MVANSRLRYFSLLSILGLVLSFSIVPVLVAQEATPAANLVTIEGPVQSIGGNAITISGINIQISPNDPVWANLQVGDVVRVQANLITQDNNTSVLVAVVIIIVVDIDQVTPTPEITPEATPETTPELTPEATSDPDDNLPIIIVIEGPVQAIHVNIITIYNINIQVDADDPILTVIQIGDIVHIEGQVVEDSDTTTIVVIAITIIIVNVDVVVSDDIVWRDSGSCNNPPPPWAPANGWRRRCEGASHNGNNGHGRGRGHDDEDDD